jgi:hypothetical protein
VLRFLLRRCWQARLDEVLNSSCRSVVAPSTAATRQPSARMEEFDRITTDITRIRFGVQRRNQFYGPGFFNADFSILKETSIRAWEKARVGFGAQFFNLLNHPNFNQPNADIANPSVFAFITGTVNSPTTMSGFVARWRCLTKVCSSDGSAHLLTLIPNHNGGRG